MFKGFVAGVAVCYFATNHLHKVVKVLRDGVAKLELKQDILRHDNPEL